MRKKALHKDIRQEIKRTFPRFLSLFLMSALGVSFFSGVRASMPDMLSTTDGYLRESNLFDLQIVSTMGLQEEDRKAVLDTQGVQEAELSYGTDLLCDGNGEQYVVHLMSESSMAKSRPGKGRLPEKADEIFLDTALASALGCEIGDTVTFYVEEGEIEDTLKRDTYTVVGTGSSPMYLSFDRGNASIGNGEVTGFAVVLPEAFSLEVSTQMNVKLQETEGYECYSEEYKNAVKEVQERIEDTTGENQSQWRLEQIREEASEEIEKARKELDEGKAEAEQELADARKELDDGWTQVQDGESQIADGRQQITEGENQIRQNQQKLEDAKSQLSQARQQTADGQAQVDAGWTELKSEEEKLNQAEEALNLKQAELEEAEAEYAQGVQALQEQETRLAGFRTEVEGKKEQMEQAEVALAAGKEQIRQKKEELQALIEEAGSAQEPQPDLESKIQELQAFITQSEEALSAQEQELLENQGYLQEAEAQLADFETQFAQAKQEAEPRLAETRKILDEGWTQISEGQAQIAAGREQITAAGRELEQAQAQVDGGNVQIAAYEQQIAEGESQITAAQKELENARTQLGQEEEKLIQAREDLEKGEEEYQEGEETAREEIAEGEKKISDAEKELEELETPQWYVQDREDAVQDYGDMEDNAQQIGAIGKVFPLIFFLVAALVSLTTMTRMVEEQRVHIGTMKALGYRKADVAMKYLWYAGSATLGGGILGIIIGQKMFPYIIQVSYGIMYDCLKHPEIPYRPLSAIQALLISLFCILAATTFSCLKELREVPAELMRPEAPKKGKRVLLEYMPFIWKRLNFTTKSTFRNLFRYKKRFFMTIFGISATMALLVTGFGLRDSIIDLAEIQFDNIQLYDVMVTLNGTDEEEDALSRMLEEEKEIRASTMVQMQMMEVSAGSASGEVYVCVPENPQDFQEMTVLKNRITKVQYTMEEEGILLTEWMADTLGVEAGDLITIKEENEKEVEVPVSGVVENYIMNYVYMTPTLYEKVFQETPEFQVLYVEFTEEGALEEKKIGTEILEQPGVYNVSYTSDTKKEINDMLQALVAVIIVLIVTAALLAYVVLYNLNNVNITERRRELATLKVLGFYDQEVAQYVYHENIILTAIGILAGIFMGIGLHWYIIHTIRVDMVMFGQHVSAVSFLVSGVLTAIFSAFVNFVMYFKLKEIDMVESLKSVE